MSKTIPAPLTGQMPEIGRSYSFHHSESVISVFKLFFLLTYFLDIYLLFNKCSKNDN